MASVVFYSSFNTLADQDWPWVQTVSTATDITLTDGQHKQTFAGLFTYGAGGILNGIVTSSSYYLNNALVYSAIGMVANARQM